MRKPQVLFLGTLDTESAEYTAFAASFECIFYTVTSADQLIHDFQTSLKDIEGIFAFWGALDLIGGYKGKVLEYSPPNLKVISICQIGYNDYDVAGLSKRGIILCNSPTPLAYESVADLALYCAILSFRNFKLFDQQLEQFRNTGTTRGALFHGLFDHINGRAVPSIKDANTGYPFANIVCGKEIRSPRGHNAVIVGFGSIGKLIGARLNSIGMNIHYVKRSPLKPNEVSELGYPATYHKTLQGAKSVADLVVIACPGTPETKHMINDQLIGEMEKPIRIINIGRGSVIQEDALVRGLQSGKVLFAGLDVFEDEPRIHPGLIGRQDVVLTPHIGSSTSELYNYAGIRCMSNISTVLKNSAEEITRVN